MKDLLSSPKKTFWNLPDAKRRRIEDALVLEFSTQGYKKASLNTLVKGLGIAKGSLYQYFENKEATFLFTFDRFTKLVKEMVGKPAMADSGGDDFWALVRRTFLAGVAFIDKFPSYFQLYLNTLFEQDVPRREEIIRRVRLFPMEYFMPLVQRGQRQGVIRPEVSVPVAVFMIGAVLDRFLQGYARSYLDDGLGLAAKSRPELLAEVDAMLDILQAGLGEGGVKGKFVNF